MINAGNFVSNREGGDMQSKYFSLFWVSMLALAFTPLAREQYFSLETTKISSSEEEAIVSLPAREVVGSICHRAHRTESSKARLKRKLIGGKWCYVDEMEKIVDNPRVEDIWDFSGGQARIEICENAENLNAYFIDTLGTILSFSSESKRQFSEGLTRVLIDGAWSYVDTSGKIVILPQYIMAGDFSGGLAPVLINDELHYIDKIGEIVSPARMFVDKQKQIATEDFYQKGDTLNVLANSGLELKNKPSLSSKTLSLVSYGDQVLVIKDKKRKVKLEVDGITGYWILVKYGNMVGYVFDGFLSKLPAPAKDCLSLREYAKERLIEVGKRDTLELAPTICDEKSSGILYVQKLRHGAVLKIGFQWEEMTETLKIPNIKLTEGFLLAKVCLGDMFKNEVFPKDSTHVQMTTYDMVSDYKLEITQTPNKQVEISLTRNN